MNTGNKYPFVTRRQIVERLSSDSAFAVECVAILQARYEAWGKTAGGSSGWMASHAAKATKLAARLASGEATTPELAEAALLAGRYSKQLATHFRSQELANRPELAAVAAMFSVAPKASAFLSAEATAAKPKSTPATPAEATTASAPRRRGRPKGSKNKPKVPAEDRRRRRTR